MESLIPPLLTAIQSLRLSIGAGRSPKDAFRTYLDENNDGLAAEYRELWLARQADVPADRWPRGPRGVYARALWDLAQRGFAGEPILHALVALDDEVARAARAELELHVSTLPFKMLIPLMLFQFPAHLLLLLGPILRDLTQTMGALR